jgi:hypothetical protein
MNAEEFIQKKMSFIDIGTVRRNYSGQVEWMEEYAQHVVSELSKCPDCDGLGNWSDEYRRNVTCEACGGSGESPFKPSGVSNKCQCEEEHGWTTVMACNKCGFICDPAWQEKKR